MWEYLSRPSAGDHVASFTSVSGPSGDHMNRFIVGGLKRPYRPRRFLQALDQLLRFSYMAPFSIPVLAPLVVRTFLADGWRRMLMIRDGIPADRLHHSDTYRSDAANSLKVYRANYFKTIRSARTDHYVDVPVQLIVNSSDPHIRPHVYEDTKRWVPRLWRRDIKAGHWTPMSHPQVLAAVGCRVHRPPRRQAGEPGAAARAGRPSARILRRHTGFCDRRGQRHRPRDRAGVRPRGRRSGGQRHRRGHRQGDRRADRRARRRRARLRRRRLRRRRRRAVRRAGELRARRARHRGQQRGSRSCRAVPRYAARGIRSGPRRSTSAESSTAAGHLAAASSTAAPAGTSSTSPRWPHIRRSSR